MRQKSVWWLGLCVFALAKREVVRFVRQRSRFVGALLQPLLFWVLFGSGLHGSFRAPNWASETMSYQEYFFPGIAVLILLFTSIFSSISLIEDRREGFLQGVLVAPVSKLGLVLGKVLGGTFLAVFQSLLFISIGCVLSLVDLAPEMGVNLTLSNSLGLIVFLSIVAFGLASLGFVIAWWFDSVQGFHAVMSVLLMPMWLLSGAFFPGGEGGWLDVVVNLNPLTYGVAGVRRLLYAGPSGSLRVVGIGPPSLAVCVTVTLIFAVATLLGAMGVASRVSRRNLN